MLRFIQRSGDRCHFERPEKMPVLLHRLLMQRGISSAAEAEAFLHPGIDLLHDPFLLSDMQTAVDKIRAAVRAGSHICIYGDYDVDGVSASAILWLYLNEIGADAEVYLPSRHSEGYGLNETALREIAGRCDLLITVDCGIASRELIDLALSLGLDCVVTDHHRPGDQLPRCPVVNPLLNNYPCPQICGAGVAFKLVHALGGLDAALEYVDLAAIATVADVVALTGENRAIVRLGLDRINTRPRTGIQALIESARQEPGKINAEAIAFRLAPRLNAGGRLGSARRSYELLTEQDPFLATALADELEQENIRRQSVEKDIRMEALRQLESFDFSAHRILIVRGKDWNSGVIGLAASHLREQFFYPVIALSETDGVLTGSCRSIPGVDIYRALSAADHLLERYGGHAQAAGLTVRAENLDALQSALDSYLLQNIPPETYVPFVEYDMDVQLSDCSERLVGALEALEPTGCGNPKPVFRCCADLIEARAVGIQGAHLRIVAAQGDVRRVGISFGSGKLAESMGSRVEMLFTPQLNIWHGRADVQLSICGLHEYSLEEQIRAAKSAEEAFLRRFLTELIYNVGYNSLSAEPISMRELKLRMTRQPQGTLVICPDIDNAMTIAREVYPAAFDLSIGRLNSDPRMFNAVSVTPCELSYHPALRTLVLVDMPVPANVPDNVHVYSLQGLATHIWRYLPSLEQMRSVFRAALLLTQRPMHFNTIYELDEALGDCCGINPLACRLSLLTMQDLKLVAVYENPIRMVVLSRRKTDPDDSALWRSIQQLRNQH